MTLPATSRATIDVHIDTLEYTREGLRTRVPIPLEVGKHNRVSLIRPPLEKIAHTAQFAFAPNRVFPLPSALSLLWSYGHHGGALAGIRVERGRPGVLQFFSHSDNTGNESGNKALSEARADVVVALFEGNVDEVRSIADGDAWGPAEYQLMLRILGCDPGPIDGDPGTLTKAALERFVQRYNAGEFHRGQSPQVADVENGALDGVRVDALTDAFTIAHAADSNLCQLHERVPAAGCGFYNSLQSDRADRDRRVSLSVRSEDPYPDSAPCTHGDANACAVVGEGRYGCMWYREHVARERDQRAAFYDPRWLDRGDGSYLLSALTNLPDEAPVVFEVFGSSEPRTWLTDGDKERFSRAGCYMYDATKDEGRGSDVERSSFR